MKVKKFVEKILVWNVQASQCLLISIPISNFFLRNFPKEAQAVTGWVWVATQYHELHTTRYTHISTCFVFWQNFLWTVCQVNIFNRKRLPWKGMKLILRGSPVETERGGGLRGISRYSQHCSCYKACTATQSTLGSAWEINKIGRFIVVESEKREWLLNVRKIPHYHS